MAASCPSNSEVAETTRILCLGWNASIHLSFTVGPVQTQTPKSLVLTRLAALTGTAMQEIPVYLVGSGNAARAMVSALSLVNGTDQTKLGPVQRLKRGQPLPDVAGKSLLLIANPHALHAQLIQQADAKGFTHIVCEKPVVVALDQIPALRQTRAFVAVCHGYRQNWGPQRMRKAIENEELGRLIAIEGRYWQSSAASHAVSKLPARNAWKNDILLSGPCDTLLDLGTHWADLMRFLVGSEPRRSRGWLSYLNAEAAHRDTHVHLELEFAGGLRTFGSVSKTVHGAGNQLEVVAIGTDAVLKWNFERPDELVQGRGSETRIFSRSNDDSVPSHLPAHHALGWLEGYVSIMQSVVDRLSGRPAAVVPMLEESLSLCETLLLLDCDRQK